MVQLHQIILIQLLLSVVEQITNNTRAFSFTTAGTGVLITVTGQPSDASIEAGAGTNATFGPVSAISSDGSTITYQWELSTVQWC